jgi:hypothetical protein
VLPMLTYISKLPPMTEEIEAEGIYCHVSCLFLFGFM